MKKMRKKESNNIRVFIVFGYTNTKLVLKDKKKTHVEEFTVIFAECTRTPVGNWCEKWACVSYTGVMNLLNINHQIRSL